MNYRVATESVTIGGAYDGWVATREGPLFGTEPDARVWALAGEAADPGAHPVLDVGAGTGRNALALARRGHPVDAVEMSPKFADIIRAEAERESLPVRVHGRRRLRDDGRCSPRLSADHPGRGRTRLPDDGRAARHLRTRDRLPGPGGRLVFNAFLARPGYTPDGAALELGQQCNTMIFTRDELATAASELPLRPRQRRLGLRVRESPSARRGVAANGLVRRVGQRSRRVRPRARGLPDRVALARLPEGVAMAEPIHFVEANGLEFRLPGRRFRTTRADAARIPGHRAHLGRSSPAHRRQGISRGQPIHARLPPHRDPGPRRRPGDVGARRPRADRGARRQRGRRHRP